MLFHENLLRDFVNSDLKKIKQVVGEMSRLQLARFLKFFAEQFPEGCKGLAEAVHLICEVQALEVFIADNDQSGEVTQ